MQLNVCASLQASKMHPNQQAAEPESKSKAKKESPRDDGGHHPDHTVHKTSCLVTPSQNWIPWQDWWQHTWAKSIWRYWLLMRLSGENRTGIQAGPFGFNEASLAFIVVNSSARERVPLCVPRFAWFELSHWCPGEKAETPGLSYQLARCGAKGKQRNGTCKERDLQAVSSQISKLESDALLHRYK